MNLKLKSMLAGLVVAAGMMAIATCAKASSGLRLDPATTHVFRGVVDDDTVGDALRAFAGIAAESESITLVLDSPGGYVDSGQRLILGMRLLQSQGHTFRCLVTGMAASMAFSVLAECQVRYCLAESGLLWHPIRTGGPRSITTKQAQVLAEQLDYYEAPFRARLIESLRVSDEYFYLHWYRETMHPGRALATELPGWITEVGGADGIPMQDLLWIPEPRGLFGMEDLARPSRLIWIAPGFEEAQ